MVSESGGALLDERLERGDELEYPFPCVRKLGSRSDTLMSILSLVPVPHLNLSASSVLVLLVQLLSSCSCEEVVLTALRAGLLSAEALVVPVPVGRGVFVFCLSVCSLASGMMSQLCGRCQTVRCVEAL